MSAIRCEADVVVTCMIQSRLRPAFVLNHVIVGSHQFHPSSSSRMKYIERSKDISIGARCVCLGRSADNGLKAYMSADHPNPTSGML
jgi:hypothetical protein